MADEKTGKSAVSGVLLLALRRLLPQRILTLAVLLMGAFCVGAAQNLNAPNLTAIAREFGLSTEQRDVILGGWMSGAFFLVGAPISLCVGVLADRTHRVRMFTRVLVLAAIVVGLTAAAVSIWQLLLLRVAQGALFGCLSPFLFSVVGDVVPPAARSSAASYVGLAIGGGTAIGQLCAGAFSAYGWRWPYAVISVLCGVSALAVAIAAVEPVRGLADAPDAGTNDAAPRMTAPPSVVQEEDTMRVVSDALRSMRVQFRRIINIRTNQLIYLQALYGTVPWSVITVFLNDYLSQEVGLSVPRATFLVMLFGIGAAVGGVVGGIAGSYVYKRGPHLLPIVFGCTQAAAAVPMWYLINAQRMPAAVDGAPPQLAGMYIMSVVSGLIAACTGPNLKALLMNVNVADTRGSVFTLQYVFDSFSKGIAPYIIGVLVAHIGRRATIFNLAMSAWLLSGALIAASSWTLRADEAEARSKAAGKRAHASATDAVLPEPASSTSSPGDRDVHHRGAAQPHTAAAVPPSPAGKQS